MKLNKALQAILAFTLLTAVSPSSFGEGGSDGGGGDSVANADGTRSLLDLVEKDQVDYFTIDSVMPSISIRLLGQNGDLPELSVLKFAKLASGGSVRTALFSNEFSKCGNRGNRGVYSDKALRWAWTNQTLENIRDEGEIRLMNPTGLAQLAIQKNGLVLVQKSEFDKLDDESKVGLYLHEAALCAVNKLDPYHVPRHGTSRIRAFVRAYIEIQLKGRPDFVLRDALTALEMPFSYNHKFDLSDTVTVKIKSPSTGQAVGIQFRDSGEVLVDLQAQKAVGIEKIGTGLKFEYFTKKDQQLLRAAEKVLAKYREVINSTVQLHSVENMRMRQSQGLPFLGLESEKY